MNLMQQAREEIEKYSNDYMLAIMSNITDIVRDGESFTVRLSETIVNTYNVSHPIYTKESGNISRVFRLVSETTRKHNMVTLINIAQFEAMVLLAIAEKLQMIQNIENHNEGGSKLVKVIIKC